MPSRAAWDSGSSIQGFSKAFQEGPPRCPQGLPKAFPRRPRGSPRLPQGFPGGPRRPSRSLSEAVFPWYEQFPENVEKPRFSNGFARFFKGFGCPCGDPRGSGSDQGASFDVCPHKLAPSSSKLAPSAFKLSTSASKLAPSTSDWALTRGKLRFCCTAELAGTRWDSQKLKRGKPVQLSIPLQMGLVLLYIYI